ncbi:flavonol synthase/flavanone 3-hydroxylase-like [Hibiscus syriacus]|uniref:flavonol synthase/flavanone 3-hydroxylase-like n=1 Tax=Hibiscus syriacus TaxID=106335 RepID=UPI0019240D9B|nr:flavonol synthase/flavanone 3-hydroxylase-like [Hibiscus syriacus]
MAEACREWGIFQVVNHGIPLDLNQRFQLTNAREVNKEYSQEVRKVVEKLFRWLSMGLGLEADVLKEGAGGEEIEYMMKINYYPPCLRPDLTLGVSFHTDLSAITVLEPNDVPGLQVFKDGLWINAKYIPGSLIIHIGDQIEVTSIPFTSLNLSLIIFFD